MAQITIKVGDRSHVLTCRDGEEDHLRRLAEMIDRKCTDATATLGVMPEARLLLTAALLIADELSEVQGGTAVPQPRDDTPQLEAFAQRVESLCAALEQKVACA